MSAIKIRSITFFIKQLATCGALIGLFFHLLVKVLILHYPVYLALTLLTLSTMTAESQEIKQAGLKITLPRIKILEILESSKVHHLSAEDVYKALLEKKEEIGLATVYRVLTQFETAGLVVRHNFEGGHSVFEVASDVHHDHIVCVKCGRVEEFADPEIEERQIQVAIAMGFELTDHDLNLFGLCPDCKKQ